MISAVEIRLGIFIRHGMGYIGFLIFIGESRVVPCVHKAVDDLPKIIYPAHLEGTLEIPNRSKSRLAIPFELFFNYIYSKRASITPTSYKTIFLVV